MTGNTKIWRAPLAGLASVAMLATLGVSAMTANAAETESDTPTGVYTVTFKDASSTTAPQVIAGDSLVDALEGKNVQATGSGTFVGWYYSDGTPVDYTAPVTGDMTVTPKFVDADEAVTVNFQGGVYGFIPNDWDNDGQVSLSKNANLSEAQLPTDKSDGKLVTSWKVTYPGEKPTTVTDLTTVKWDRPETGTITIEPQTYATNVQKLYFNGNANAYALNQAADGTAPTGGTGSYNYGVDVEAGKTIDVPTIVSKFGGSGTITVPDQWLDSGKNVVTSVTANGDASYTLGDPVTYYLVKFNTGEGGSKVAGQYVKNGDFATKPSTVPTRKGFVFRGWTKSDHDTPFSFDTTKITNASEVIYAAWKTSDEVVDLKVTFKDTDYRGAHEAVSMTVSSDELVLDQAPEWTREGYVLAGWTYGSGPSVVSATTTAGDLNGRNDAVVTAKWVAIKTDVAKAALQYVPVNDTVAAFFTPSSWKAYTKAHEAAEAKYNDALASTVGEIDAATSAEIVSELKAAWESLQFANKGTDSVDSDTAATNALNVHRLSKGGEHFYSADANEIKALTSKLSTSGNWTDEGNLLYSLKLNKAAVEAMVNFENAVETAGYSTGADQVLAQLNEVATPIIKPVYRVYNTLSGDHVWTVDANEYEVLSNQAQWSGEGVAFYVPSFNGARKVYRLYKGNRHLLSTDSNEVKVLSTKQGWTDEGVAFLAY